MLESEISQLISSLLPAADTSNTFPAASASRSQPAVLPSQSASVDSNASPMETAGASSSNSQPTYSPTTPVDCLAHESTGFKQQDTLDAGPTSSSTATSEATPGVTSKISSSTSSEGGGGGGKDLSRIELPSHWEARVDNLSRVFETSTT